MLAYHSSQGDPSLGYHAVLQRLCYNHEIAVLGMCVQCLHAESRARKKHAIVLPSLDQMTR
jgi:hypothetical protein